MACPPTLQDWHLLLGSIALEALWGCGSLPALAACLYAVVMTLHLQGTITCYLVILQIDVVWLFLIAYVVCFFMIL